MSKDNLRNRLEASLRAAGNEKCCDCGELKPTWASILIPPKGSPFGSPSIGGFCCMNCSGIHRGLGTHVCFVRSVTLDDWKESEVQAMEYGGNQIIQSIFGSTHDKLSSTADLATRNEFIRRKYIGLEFFDPKGYIGIERNVSLTIAPPPDRLNRRGMMSRQASMPALHASKGMNVSREVPVSFEKMNESCNAFATSWEAFPPSSSQMAPIAKPTKKATKSDNRDLSTSWHPRSPTENVWTEKIRPTPRVPTSRRENHGQTRSKQRSKQSSDLSGDGRDRDGLSDGSGSFDFDATNERSSKSDDEIGDSSRVSTRRAIRGRKGEIIRNSDAVSSTRQSKRVGSTSTMATSSEKDELISKLKECLAGDAKDSEEKLKQMAKALDEAQKRRPSDSENGRRSRNSNRLSVSEHGRRRSVSRKRGVRRMKSNDEQQLSIQTNEIVTEQRSSPRINQQNKSSSPRRERRSGQHGDRSRSKSRDGRRRGSQRPRASPNQNDVTNGSARESVDEKNSEKSRRVPPRSGSGSRRKSPEAGNEGNESKEGIEKSRRVPRRSGSGSKSGSRRTGAQSETPKKESSEGWGDFPKSPGGDMDTGFGGEDFSLVASMKPSKTTTVVRKQVKSDLWNTDSAEESDEEIFSDFEDPFNGGEKRDQKKQVSEPLPIMKDGKCSPAIVPNAGTLDISALTFYS